MKVSFISTSEEKVIKNSGISEKELNELLENLGKFFAENGDELVVIPVHGIIQKIANIYKKNNGEKIIGLIPLKDKRCGIEHEKENFSVADEIKEMNSWYDSNGEIAAMGDICVCIGLSGGVLTEIGFLKYHKKFFNNKTKLIIFENTVSKRLHKEIEGELKKDLYYVKSFEEFKGLYNAGD